MQGLDFCEVERSSVHLTVAHHGTPVLLKWDIVDTNLIVCKSSRLCSPSLYPRVCLDYRGWIGKIWLLVFVIKDGGELPLAKSVSMQFDCDFAVVRGCQHDSNLMPTRLFCSVLVFESSVRYH